MEVVDSVDSTNFYPLQVNAYGSETMEKIISLSVFIYGMRGLGVEIAKNIIISGPRKVTIYDDSMVTYADLGSNSYLKESHVGKISRSEACLSKLKELNSSVVVDAFKGELANNFDILKGYKVVVISELILKETAEALNTFCRDNRIGFIYCACLGLSGFSFTDFGENFVTVDTDGEEIKQYNIKSVNKSNPGVVMIDDKEGTVSLELSHGDFVSFKEITGMTELNETPPRPIRVLSHNTFTIEDTTKFTDYISGGIVEQAKIPRPFFFKTLKEAFENVYHDEFDFSTKSWNSKNPMDLKKINRNELLHLSFKSLHNFFDRNGRLPYINSLEDQEKVIEISKNLYSVARDKKRDWAVNLDNIEEYVIRNVCKWARVNIPPVCAFFGGIVAQEVVKITSKYTPFYQWFWCDFFDCVNKRSDSLNGMNANSNLDESFNSTNSIASIKPVFDKNDRNQDQIAVIGNEMHVKLSSLNILLIGGGALANEILKNLSLMGISSTSTANFTIVDFENNNDNLEVDIENIQNINKNSKLQNFRSRSLVKEINKLVNCTEITARSVEELEDLLEDEFWSKQDILILAQDNSSSNIQLKSYLDHKSTWFGKILISAETLGIKAYSQVVLPNLTSNVLSCQEFVKNISLYGLSNFPYLLEHCKDWAKKLFNSYFIDELSELNQLLFPEYNEDEDEVEEDELQQAVLDKLVKKLPNMVAKEKLANLRKLIEVAASKNFKNCVELAIHKFNEMFNNKVKQVVINDSTLDKGNMDISLNESQFSLGDNRCPNPITLSLNDNSHLLFLNYYSILIANALNISVVENNKNLAFIKENAESILNEDHNFGTTRIPALTRCSTNTSRTSVNKTFDLENEKEIRNMKDGILTFIDKNKKNLSRINLNLEGALVGMSEEFIKITSSLRSQIFKINESEFVKSKTPYLSSHHAISGTTSTIAGFAAVQLYSIVRNDKKTSNIRNAFINLGTSFLIACSSFPKVINKSTVIHNNTFSKAIPDGWVAWDKIEIKGSITIQDFLKYFEENYQVDVKGVVFTNGIKKQEFTIQADFLETKLEEFVIKQGVHKIFKNYKKSYLALEIKGITKEGENAYLPVIKYTF